MASERSHEVDKQVPVISCLDDLIHQLRDVFQTDCVNVDYVRSLLSAYKSNSKDWKKYAVFDPHRYTRNLVDAGNDRFNLIMLCWGESHGSSIHDHSKNAHCFVKILDGQLKETMFDWPTSSATNATEMIGTVEHQPLRQIAVNHYEKDEVTYINDSMGLHRVENPSHTSPAVSLHLYSPPFETCQSFDERTGKARTVKMVFWSKHGSPVSSADVNASTDSRQQLMTANDVHSKNSSAVVHSTEQ